MSGLYQAAKGYVRCLRWLARFDPATLCLASAFVFSGAGASMAHHADPYPDFPGIQANGDNAQYYRYSSNAPVGFLIWFDDEVEGFGLEDIHVLHRNSGFDCLPTVSNLREEIRRYPDTPEYRAAFPDQAGTVEGHYFGFDITPKGPFDIIIGIGGPGTRYHFVNSDHINKPPPPRFRHNISYNGTGNFAVPVANAGKDRTVASRAEVILQGTGSTGDCSVSNTYQWTRTGGTGDSGVDLTGANSSRLSFTADTLAPGAADVTHIFDLIATNDNRVQSVADSVTVTVIPSAPPVAEAGPAKKVASGAKVSLDGTGSSGNAGRTIKSWAWERTSGTGGSVKLSDANVAEPTFTADTLAPGAADVTHIFTLTVTDNGGETDTDTVKVTVTAPFAPTVVNPGPDLTVASGTTVTLDGTGSTIDHRRIRPRWGWKHTGGTGRARLLFANLSQTTPILVFTADTLAPGAESVTHELVLSVSYSDGGITHSVESNVVTVTIIPNEFVYAVAGDDQTVASGAMVTLDGTDSLAVSGRSIASYAWERTSGTGASVTLSDKSVAKPTFTADTPEPGSEDVTHVFTLTVTDNRGETDTDTVTVTVTAPFAPTVANPGPDQTVASGTTVRLDGNGSTSDRRRPITGWEWRQTGGTGREKLLVGNVSQITPILVFTADTLAPGAESVTHELILRAGYSDGGNYHIVESNVVTITIIPPTPPDAVAGDDQSVPSGAKVTLDGTGSTAVSGRSIASYAWERTSGTGPSVTLSDASVANPYFTTDALLSGAGNQTYVFTLTVTDNWGETDTDTVTVTVMSPNLPPVAVLGADQTVPSGAFVTLDGRRSMDPDNIGSIASYAWQRTGGTGKRNLVSTPTLGKLDFRADTLAPGAGNVTHIFELIVTDNNGARSEPVSITVTVTAAGGADAGSDQTVDSGATVTLDGSGSSMTYGRINSYVWRRTGGTADGSVTLTGPRSVRSTFVADTLVPGDADVIHEFDLQTHVIGQNSNVSWVAFDSTTVTVELMLLPTLVRAGGDSYILSGHTISLIGQDQTDPKVDINDRFWLRTGGTGDETVVPEIPRRSGGRGSNTNLLIFTADMLEPGDEHVTHYFTYNVIDSTGKWVVDDVKVTVFPRFPIPVANAGPDQLVVSGSTVTLDGRGSTTIPGRTITIHSWTRTGGTGNPDVVGYPYLPAFAYTGYYTPAGWGHHYAPTFTFTADTLSPSADDMTHEFVMRVTDESRNQARDNVTVTVTPSSPPVADAGLEQTVFSGNKVTLYGTGSRVTDPRRTITSWAWTRTGGTGAQVTLTDENASKPGFTVETLAPGAEDATYEFTLTVTDSLGETDTDTVTVTAISQFVDTVANAGPDRTVASGTEVTLDSSGSTTDRRRTINIRRWEQTSGPDDIATVRFGQIYAQSTLTFTAPALEPDAPDVAYEFALTVIDSNGNAKDDSVTITVTAGNVAPVANAGPDQTVDSLATVTLDATASTFDHRSTKNSWAWERTDGTGGSVTLSDASVAKPTFTADRLVPGAADVTHEFTLTVMDSKGETDTDTVTITVIDPFVAPVADAGDDQTVLSGATFTLDSMDSTVDPRRTIANVTWKQSDLNTHHVREFNHADGNGFLKGQSLDFTAPVLNSGDADVTLVFHLYVTDSGDIEATDSVTVTVIPRAPPVADAGDDQMVFSGIEVTLDGTDSRVGDRRRTITSYAWERTSGTGGSVTLSDASLAKPTFTADRLAPGATDVTHLFTLTVTDNLGETNTDTVKVTVMSMNLPPVAVVGPDQTVPSGAQVWLDGRNSRDIDGTVASWSWQRTGGTGNMVQLSTVSPGFINFRADTLAPGAGDVTHIFELIVTDDEGVESEPASITVTVTTAGGADAGDDQSVPSETKVTLDGSGSSMTYGRIDSYAWRRIGGTGGSVTLTGPRTVQPTFIADTLAPDTMDVTHEFELQTLAVGQNTNVSWIAFDRTIVTVTAPPVVIPPDPQINVLPVADAGPNRRVLSKTTVTLDGTGSTAVSGRTIKSYAWERVSGTGDDTVALSDPGAPQPTFTADTLADGAADVTHVFSLVVTDSTDVSSVADTVTITVIFRIRGPGCECGSGSDSFLRKNR